MSNYTQSTFFVNKDNLPTGNTNKKILGSEVDTELSAISVAIATKLDSSAGTLSTVDTGDSFVVLDVSASNATKTITAANLFGQLGDLEAAVDLSSGSPTTATFTSIPSTAKRIVIMLTGVSTSGGDTGYIQLGPSSGIVTTGYLGASTALSDAAAVSIDQETMGFGIKFGAAAGVVHGIVTLDLVNSSTNTWVASGNLSRSDARRALLTAGTIALSGTLDRVRLVRSGSSTFDAGKVAIRVES